MARRGRPVVGQGSPFGGLAMFNMPHSLIRSIQQGSILLDAASSNTATITSVDLPNTIILFPGFDFTANGAGGDIRQGRMELTNATTVTFSRGSGATGNMRGNYVVIEFWPGVLRSVQRGTISVADTATSGTATLATTVQNTQRCWTEPLGWQTTGTSATFEDQMFRVDLTNGTTVTANRSDNDNAFTVGYQVAEFW